MNSVHRSGNGRFAAGSRVCRPALVLSLPKHPWRDTYIACMRYALSLTILAGLLVGCAPSTELSANYCNAYASRDRGYSDASYGKPVKSGAENCPADQQAATAEAYLAGYQAWKRENTPSAPAGGVNVKIDAPLPKGGTIQLNSAHAESWSCEVSAFGKTYTANGSGEGATRSEARAKCEATNNAMFCKNVRCKLDR